VSFLAQDTDGPVPGFGLLIGAMLSAAEGRVYALGSGKVAGDASVEEYWKWRRAARLSTGGRIVATGPVATRMTMEGRPSETKPGSVTWLGWTDRLLHPEHLYIWGRRGEDWRLREVEGWSTAVDGAVALSIEHVEDGRVGLAHVAPSSGRVLLLDLPGFLHWQLDVVNDAPDVAAWPARRWFRDCVPPDFFR